MTTAFPPFPNGSSFDGTILDVKTNTVTLDAARVREQKKAVIDAGLRSLDHCMATQHSASTASKKSIDIGSGRHTSIHVMSHISARAKC
jgi:hypothetical protein